MPIATPFAEDVFTWPSDKPQLIGCRCGTCGAVFFPEQPGCGACGSTDLARELLPRTGTLHAWTTQDFLPKAPYEGGETPETFKGFGVGLVNLEGVVMVEGRLTEGDPAKLKFDMPVELAIVPFRSTDDGEVVTFAFKPV
ncbi:MAG: OB-fold domain-containing protein [Sphingomonadales bacterium]|nr:OB-fold domain-containing protein [Sphingomonadales bacterium]